jgi:hypothetical protein
MGKETPFFKRCGTSLPLAAQPLEEAAMAAGKIGLLLFFTFLNNGLLPKPFECRKWSHNLKKDV